MKNKLVLFTVFFLSAVLFFFIYLKPEAVKMQKNSRKNNQCGLNLSDSELKRMLTPEQYRIMRQNGTEEPFKNAFWDNKHPGIYVDAISGKPLFASFDKFDSGTGWPSFTKPLNEDEIVEREDDKYGLKRVEVRSKSSDSHLGHVFTDGPQPSRLRYCINSASLRFIPVEDLKKDGYTEYLQLFKEASKDNDSKAGLPQKTQTAYFAAGCFWGVEAVFREQKGVLDTKVGFMGGKTKNPTYKQVSTDTTGHAETVEVKYDPSEISYEELLNIFWNIHDPTSINRQQVDIGSQYRSVIFYNNQQQKQAAEFSKGKLKASKKFKAPITTEILPATQFTQAEDYHQRYYEKRGIKPACHINNGQNSQNK